MKKLEAESVKKRRLCQHCGLRPWAAITVATGARRCLACWGAIYFSKVSA